VTFVKLMAGARCRGLAFLLIAAGLPFALDAELAPAHAGLTISSAKTRNVTCTSGICIPSAGSANLNAGDLAAYLALGNVAVDSSGVGVEIEVNAPLTWSNANSLSLVSSSNLIFFAPVTITGTGGLSLTYGRKGDLGFAPGASITIQQMKSTLSINSHAYRLVSRLSQLATLVPLHPEEHYALVRDYDASIDGTYPGAVVPGTFSGTFEGLGHTISNLTISEFIPSGTFNSGCVGLFSYVSNTVLRDIALHNFLLTVTAADTNNGGITAGALFACQSTGTAFVDDASVDGTVTIPVGVAGGLVGGISGSIVNSRSSAAVVALGNNAGAGSTIGGLAGSQDTGLICNRPGVGRFQRVCRRIGGTRAGCRPVMGQRRHIDWRQCKSAGRSADRYGGRIGL
jgi:hypothetical protein